jgi:type II secretory pathway pseudopilin PulG
MRGAGTILSIALASLAAALAAGSARVAGAEEEREAAVEAAREALENGWVQTEHPWYNDDTDGPELVDVSEPVDPDWSWFRDFWNWLTQPWGFSLFGIDLSWGLLLLIVVASVLLGILIYVLIRIYQRREREQYPSSDEESAGEADETTRIEALPFPVQRRGGTFLSSARACYEARDYDQAIVFLYSHELVELDKHHAIRLHKGKTNRQYMRELRHDPALRSLVEQTMCAFEDAFFGKHSIGRERFEACWNRLEEFNRLLAGAAWAHTADAA